MQVVCVYIYIYIYNKKRESKREGDSINFISQRNPYGFFFFFKPKSTVMSSHQYFLLNPFQYFSK